MSHPNKRIVCRLHVDEQAQAIEFTWSEGSSSFKPYVLVGRQVTHFRDNIKEARERLFRLVKYHGEPRDLPHAVACRRACFPRPDPVDCRRACFELARAGHYLYNQIFDRAADGGEHVDAIEGWLRAATAASEVESLEFVCDGRPWFAPWNLVYDEDPKDSAFEGGNDGLDCLVPFWGMRYNVCGGRQVNPLRRMPLPAKPEVLVVIDPVVLESLARYGEPDGTNQRMRLEAFLRRHGVVPITSLFELEWALKERRPHIIYWLGHARPDVLYLGQVPVCQNLLGNLLRNTRRRIPDQLGGLVFLNACRTAEPAELGSFLETFHDAEFSGLIGTEEQTFDSFAHPFGLSVLEQFLTPGTPIGGVLRDLREAHGPLGLLYGAYCPPDLHIRVEQVPARLEARPAVSLTAAGGRMLSGTDLSTEGAMPERPLPDLPYLPLGSYGPGHRALFAGRDEDIARFALILDRAETRVMVLHGESGVGKTSFLRAGLIPYLEEDCIGYRFLRDRSGVDEGARTPVLFVRATEDPAAQMAQALCESVARPVHYRTPTGEVIKVDLPWELATELDLAELPVAAVLADRLRDDPSLLARLLIRLSRVLPVTPVLVIDQAEEVFTLARSAAEDGGPERVLEMIRHVGEGRGDYKLIVSLRTEYYGRFVSAIRGGPAAAAGVRDYLLTDLDEAAMVEVIRRPTLQHRLPHTTEIPFEKYRGFCYADDVPEDIARQVAHSGRTDGVALLLQVICAQLFERAMAREDHCVTEDDLRAIGGFEGALSGHVRRQIERFLPRDTAQLEFDAQLEHLHDIIAERRPITEVLHEMRVTVLALRDPRSDAARFQVLLTHLTLRQVDGTLTTGLLHVEDLRDRWDGQTPFDEMLHRACDFRLLRTTTRRLDGRSEVQFVSLGHDALAKVADRWKQELERRDERRRWQIRGGLAAGAALIFAGLSLLAWQGQNRAVAAREQARANERRANDSASEAIKAYAAEAKQREEAEQQRNRALQAEKLARAHEAKANDSAAEARAVLAFFADHVLAAARPEGQGGGLGREVTLRKAVDTAERQFAAELQGRPAAEASVRRVLGLTYYYLGELSQAISQDERALELFRAMLGPDHPDTLATQLELGLAYRAEGKLDKAIHLLEQTLEARKTTLGPDHPETLAAQHELAVAYQVDGRLDLAIPLLERTLEARKATLGPVHPSTLDTQNNLASAYQVVERLDLAIPLFERTLEARKATLGPDHPDTLASQHDLAFAYQVNEKLSLAIPLFERTLEARKAKLGPDHPLTLNTQSGLALAYQRAGNFDEAITHFLLTLEAQKAKHGVLHHLTLEAQRNLANAYQVEGRFPQRGIALLKQTLEAQKASLPPNHPDTLASQQDLAYAYQLAGQLDLAIPLFERTLEARKATLGAVHRLTLASQNNLAYAYQLAGQLDLAIPLFERTLEARKATLGADHLETLASQNNLAYAHQVDGKLDRAIPLFEQALAAWKAKYGPDHVATLTPQNNLAYAYQVDGRLDLAIPLFERTLGARRTKLGPDHPDTLASQNNLAYAYQVDGRLDLAIPLFERTLEVREAKLPPDHADTLASQYNLAFAYAEQIGGERGRGIALLEKTLGAWRTKFGPDHADTLASQRNLAYAYRVNGRLDQAIWLLEQTLTAWRNKLGPDHPETLASQNNLAAAYQEWGEHPRAEQLFRDIVSRQASKHRAGHPIVACAMAMLGGNLLKQHNWHEAELFFRKCLPVHEEKSPGSWTTFHIRSELGGSLLGQKKYAEAEPLIVSGYEGMRFREAKIRPHDKSLLVEAGERVVQFYDAWGKPDKAAEWRGKIGSPADPRRPGPPTQELPACPFAP
jgi:tetratricopeptide (TPR) repeat protein